EGSQLVSLLLETKPREHVVDFCAGAGGKTLHLAVLMENRGQIIACDVSKKRLDDLRTRLKRAGVDNVHPQLISDENDRCMKKYHGKMARVLIDAPCSGSGTLRRNPDMKWRPLNLESLIQRQQSILAAAAPLVKPGGRLVYATCSLLKEENEEVITDFLAKQTAFRLIPVAAILARLNINLGDHAEGTLLRLLPHHHATDGFFAAVLERQIGLS
ncbi:MAG: Fmu (Sun) domain-containing protein, partial [Halothiobacillaceae bacterium]